MSISRFTLLFRAVGTRELQQIRSTLTGIDRQSYISSNAFSRNFSTMERRTIRSVNNMDRSLNKLNKSSSTLRYSISGMFAGLALAPLLSAVGVIQKINRVFVMSNSQIQTSRILIEEMLGGGKEKAMDFINVMKNMSASFGGDMTETMNASRGLLQPMKQIGSGDVQARDLERLLKIVMTINALDTENRGLAYTSYSIKEALTGQGLGDFRSLRNRLEINLGRGVEKSIVESIKNGDLRGAIGKLEGGLERIGINSDRILGRLTKEGFTQNISRMESYISRVFQTIGEGAYNTLTEPLYKANIVFGSIFNEGGKGAQILADMGKTFENEVARFLPLIYKMGNSLVLNKNAIIPAVREIIYSGYTLFRDGLGLYTAFFAGLFGVTGDSNDNLKSTANLLERVSRTFNNIGNFFTKITPYMNAFGAGINKIAKELSTMTGLALFGTGTGATGIIGASLGLGAVLTEGIASILATINKIIGRHDYRNEDPYAPSGLSTSLLSYAGSALSVVSIFAMLRSFRTPRIATNAPTGQVLNAQGLPMPSTSVPNVINSYGTNPLNLRQMGAFAGDLRSSNKMLVKSIDELKKKTPNFTQFSGSNIEGQYNVQRNKIIRDLRESRARNNGVLSQEDRVRLGKMKAELDAGYNINKMEKQVEKNIAQSGVIDKIASRIQTARENAPSFSDVTQNTANIVGTVAGGVGMYQMLGGSPTAVTSLWQRFTTGTFNFLRTVITFGARVNPVTGSVILLTTALAGLASRMYQTSSEAKALKTIKEQEEATNNARTKRSEEVFKRYGIDPKEVKKLYEGGIAGKAPNQSQLASMFAGLTGQGFRWVDSAGKEDLRRRVLTDKINRGVINEETGRMMLGDVAYDSLKNSDKDYFLEANMTISGLDAKGRKEMEDIITNAFMKMAEKNKIKADKDSIIVGIKNGASNDVDPNGLDSGVNY